jgi:gem associated protein 8
LNVNDNNSSKDGAPFQRSSKRREDELVTLYGEQSKVIHLIETNLQMKYDKNLDKYEPKYWPSLPLRL